MAKSKRWQWIPTSLTLSQFEQFILPHLITGSRGPAPTLPLHTIFNYILQLLYTGCQWKDLSIEKNHTGCPEIHYTRIYRMFRYWRVRGCIDAIFAGFVSALHRHDLLDISVVHGDGTTTAAKKGGDHIGFSGHKKMKGDKIVAFCDPTGCGLFQPAEITRNQLDRKHFRSF